MSVDDAIAAAVRENERLVDETRRRVPKAWGKLAAQGVTAFRRIAGRPPDDAERRAIWAGLWHAAAGDRGPMR